MCVPALCMDCGCTVRCVLRCDDVCARDCGERGKRGGRKARKGEEGKKAWLEKDMLASEKDVTDVKTMDRRCEK